MESTFFKKEIALIGEEKFTSLQNYTILIVGIGGVGCYVVEALVRAGLKQLILVDDDSFEATNINRQLYATTESLNVLKVQAAKQRCLQINNSCKISCHSAKVQNLNLNELTNNLNLNNLFIADCIDDIEAKLQIYKFAYENNIKIISSMGTGNKLSTNNFHISSLNKSEVCPLAKIIRKRVNKELGLDVCKYITVIYSDEETVVKNYEDVPTISYVPAVCGLKIAEYIITKIIN